MSKKNRIKNKEANLQKRINAASNRSIPTRDCGKEMKERLVKQYEIFVHNMLRIATNEAPHITTSFIKEGNSPFSTVDMAVVVFGFDKNTLTRYR